MKTDIERAKRLKEIVDLLGEKNYYNDSFIHMCCMEYADNELSLSFHLAQMVIRLAQEHRNSIDREILRTQNNHPRFVFESDFLLTHRNIPNQPTKNT
jgi:hypothetical protein